MPSLISTLLREQIRLVKPLMNRMSIEANRSAQDRLGMLGAKALSEKIHIHPIQNPQFAGEYITPAEAEQNTEQQQALVSMRTGPNREGNAILYLHGGAYTAGGAAYARGFGGLLCANTNFPVLTVAYRLAPEYPFPTAVDDALAGYEHLLGMGYAPDNIYLAGESAGGGLVLCLTHKLKELAMPLPGRIVSISPWADLAMTGETYTLNEKIDPTLSQSRLAYSAKAYSKGADLHNPLISPIYGDFTDFPPTLLIAGDREILLDDAKAVYACYKRDGAHARLHIEPGMWHVYVLYPTPEAKAAQRMIAAFLVGELALNEGMEERPLFLES